MLQRLSIPNGARLAFRQRPPQLLGTLLVGIEAIVLVTFAGPLALFSIALGFDVGHLFCDQETAASDSYTTWLGRVLMVGWLTLPGACVAYWRGRQLVAALLPVAWFVALVAIAVIAAMAIGPQPCLRGSLGF